MNNQSWLDCVWIWEKSQQSCILPLQTPVKVADRYNFMLQLQMFQDRSGNLFRTRREIGICLHSIRWLRDLDQLGHIIAIGLQNSFCLGTAGR